MPVYTFLNEQNGMEYDDTMSIAEYEKFMEENPHIKRVWNTAPAMVGDHVMGVGPKTDSGFNDVMSNIASKHPTSPMAQRYGSGKSIAQHKAKRVVDKYTK
jgi:hypothetical protein|tara:strand:+ start:516 stop:818 length:303 start_codon:yes stop_codon:yes gene_type:complete